MPIMLLQGGYGMFGNEKKPERMDSKMIDTIIGEKTMIQGTLIAEETLRIDGTVKGEVISKGLVIIGEHGTVEGDISAEEILIAGTLNGNLHIQEKTEITRTGSILGDIATKSLVIDEGAAFKGSCSMETHGIAESATLEPSGQEA